MTLRTKILAGLLLLMLLGVYISAQPSPGAAAPGALPPVLLERVSVALDPEEEPDKDSHAPALSGDGQYVVFLSYASNLVISDTNGLMDVFVYDRSSQETELVSIGYDGSPANGEPSRPSISSDGRYVAFGSFASNLVISDTNGIIDENGEEVGSDVFVFDRQTDTTERVSLTSEEEQIAQNAFSRRPAISGDGRFVVFYSNAQSLAPDHTAPDTYNVYLRDRILNETTLVTDGYDDTPANEDSLYPTLSDDGNWVAYYSLASNLVISDTVDAQTDVFLYNRLSQETWRVSLAPDGSDANGLSDLPAISADGRFVAFVSSASNLVAGDTNGCEDIFVYDRDGTPGNQIELVSRPTFGGLANANSDVPSISADGRYVAYYSYATNLSLYDKNEYTDVFRYDRQEQVNELVSLGDWLQTGDDSSLCSAISQDGQVVAFYSHAQNLLPGDSNGFSDVYLRDFSRVLPMYILRLPLIFK